MRVRRGRVRSRGDATIALTYTHTRLGDSRYFSTTAAAHAGVHVRYRRGERHACSRPRCRAVSPTSSTPRIPTARHDAVPPGERRHELQPVEAHGADAVAIGQIASGKLGTDADGNAVNYAQIPVLANSNSSRQLAVMAGIRVNFERGTRAAYRRATGGGHRVGGGPPGCRSTAAAGAAYRRSPRAINFNDRREQWRSLQAAGSISRVAHVCNARPSRHHAERERPHDP